MSETFDTEGWEKLPDFIDTLPEYKPFKEKWFYCPICNKGFNLEKWMLDHKKENH